MNGMRRDDDDDDYDDGEESVFDVIQIRDDLE